MSQNKEISDLRNSKQILENSTLLIEIPNIVGKPIEKIYTLLSDGFSKVTFSENSRRTFYCQVSGKQIR